MKRLILCSATGLAALFAGCIENDLPYPVVEIAIEAIEAEGLDGEPVISAAQQSVTLPLGGDRRHPQRAHHFGLADRGRAVVGRLPRDVRPAHAALHHAVALSGVWLEHRGHAAYRPPLPRAQAGGRGRDRCRQPHGHGLRIAQHRSEKRRGHGAEARTGRHHDLHARHRGHDLVRDGAAGGRRGARPHGAVAPPCRADRRGGAHHAVRRMGAHRMAGG